VGDGRQWAGHNLLDDRLAKVREEVDQVIIDLLEPCGQLALGPVEGAQEGLDVGARSYLIAKAYRSAKKCDALSKRRHLPKTGLCFPACSA
jgi:hypothetical protein